MLINNLYRIISNKLSESGDTTYEIKLNSDSEIYKAHFPSKPITPGVCIVQIIVEILSIYMNRKCSLSYVKNIKFLQLIDPALVPNVNIGLRKIECTDDTTISFHAVVFDNNTIFTKASLQCKI